MEHNFIVAILGDNDFGHLVRDALKVGWDDYSYVEQSPKEWKDFIIAYVIGEQMKRRPSPIAPIEWDGLKKLELYLDTKLRVTFECKAPELDHDGGSAYLDINLSQVWTF